MLGRERGIQRDWDGGGDLGEAACLSAMAELHEEPSSNIEAQTGGLGPCPAGMAVLNLDTWLWPAHSLVPCPPEFSSSAAASLSTALQPLLRASALFVPRP